MNTTNTLREELKKYLRNGELVTTSTSLETMLNEVLDELKTEEKVNQEKIQKARELDSISESMLAYFNKYYPAENDAQKELYEELCSRNGLEELFKTVANIVEVCSDDNIKSILEEIFNFETSKSSDAKPFKDRIAEALADLGLDEKTSSSGDPLVSFVRKFPYKPKNKKSDFWLL